MINHSRTLARRLGTTTHRSVLLHRAAALGVGTPATLAALAAHRGCRYYLGPNSQPENLPGVADFSNEALAIALLHPAHPWDAWRIRIGAAMLGAPGTDPIRLARLAMQERCVAVVRYIAEAGAHFEPSNAFWRQLLAKLNRTTPVPLGVLPHPTRFIAMTGFSPTGQRANRAVWIRPFAAVPA
jgi:hypothetical protein